MAACRGAAPAPAAVTFNKDIGPILFANCAMCHRPGEVAPFALLTYADAVKRAARIAEVTTARHMPPWLPDRGEFPIAGARGLRDDQIDRIARWVKSGAPEGDAADLPAAPVWPAGWQLGRPDLVVTPDRPFAVGPMTDDVYRNLVIRAPVSAGRFVRAVEFRTNGAPIHHAVIRVDTTQASRRVTARTASPASTG